MNPYPFLNKVSWVLLDHHHTTQSPNCFLKIESIKAWSINIIVNKLINVLLLKSAVRSVIRSNCADLDMYGMGGLYLSFYAAETLPSLERDWGISFHGTMIAWGR